MADYFVSSGVTSSGMILDEYDIMSVLSGGTTVDTAVNYWCLLMVSSGGTAVDTTVNAMGALIFDTDGKVTGKTVIDPGARLISAYKGGILDFDLTRTSPGADALLNNLSIVQGNPSFTLTIDDTQEEGLYKLAELAAGFDRTIKAVSPLGEDLFTLTVGGDTQTLGKRQYTLNLDDTTLAVTITRIPDVTGDLTGFCKLTDGLVASNVIVHGLGQLYVSSGGTANDTTVNSDGEFYIYDGGLVRNTTVNSYGWMFVSSGGTAAGTTVNSGGFMFVSSGGTATGTTLNSWGVTSVLFGGTANSTTVNCGGHLLVMFGGRANDTTVNEGGTLYVVDGGTAADTTFNSKGSLILSSGGKLTGKMRFGSDMTMDVASGSILDFDLTQTAPDADALVYNRSSRLLNTQFTCTLTVDGTEADGKYNLMDGAAGFKKTITIVNTLGEELGTLTVGGGTRTIGKRKYTLSLDESMLSVTVKLIPDLTGDLKREAYLSSGMYASGVNVLSGGELDVLNGGFASMTTVNSKGIMYVSSGGKADGVTVYFDCDLYVSSGGTATQIVENGGYVNVNSDASATFIPNSFSGYTYSSYRNYATLHSGTTGTSLTATGSGNIIVNGGYTEATTLETKGNLRVFCGGKASSNYIDSGGILYVSSGGTAINNLVFSGGTMYVSSGGTGIYTSVYSGGSMYVSAGGSADLVIVDGGYLEVSSGGTATMVDWEPCNGYLRIGNGADVTFRDQHSGVYYGTGNQLLSSAMVMESKTLPDGTYDSLRMYVMSGGTANATTVNEGGRIEVWSGGTANGTTLNGSGSMTLYSGGTANDTTINARAYLYVPRGGSVNGTTIHYKGNMSVSSGGKANGVTVNSGGSMTVSAGGMATQIMENGGYVSVNDTTVTFIPNVISGISVEQTRVTLHSGTTATDATIDASGYMYVYSGGSANAITVNSGGALYVSSGGTADSVTVHSGGWLFVSGGTATNVDWTPCVGKVLIGAGAYVKFVSQYSGVYYGADEQLLSNARVMISKTVSVDAQWHKTIMYVMTDGLASCTTVNSGGSVYVSAGGTADTTTVNAGGYVYDYGSACCTTVNKDGRLLVYSDAAADTTTVNSGGSMTVSSGGAASNTTVNSGGCMIISSGGSTVDTTTVNSGGSMIVYSGGTATGKMTFAKGAYVSVLEGANLDFDINIVSPDNDPFVNDLSLVQGAPTYTLTVAGTEELGDYKLAEGAAGFDKTITVVYGRSVLGTLTVGGDTLFIDGREYNLVLNGGSLGVRVGKKQVDLTGDLTSTYKVTSGKVTSRVNILDKGKLIVFRGGFAEVTNVNSECELIVSSGGTATKTTITSGGKTTVYAGGSATGIVAEEGARLGVQVANGAYAKGTYAGSAFEITSTVSGFAIPTYCELVVFNGGVASDTTVKREGWLYLEEGGKASDVTVASGGSAIVYGGSATGIVAEDGAFLSFLVAPGTYAKGTYAGSAFEIDSHVSGYTVHSGVLAVFEGGKAEAVTVNIGGQLVVDEGGSATQIRENGGAVLLEKGARYSFVSNTFTGVHVSGMNSATAHSGTTAVDTTVGIEGELAVFSGGVASGVTVASKGQLVVSSGGKMTGKMTFENGASVIARDGAILDFDLRRTTVGADALVNDLACIEGDASFTLTVDGSQKDGLYLLAGNATGFGETITVVNTSGATLGTIDVGQTASFGGMDYTLNLNGDGLLMVKAEGSAPTPPPTPSGTAKSDIDGNGVSDVMFVWTGEHGEGNYQHGYWMNGTNEWQSANSSHPAEWDNLGCYDMTGDGKADSVLVGNVVVNGVKGAYIGYYADANDLPDGSTWVNIGYLNNADEIAWKNKVGNLTGGTANSIVWYAPELYALGAWTDGTENWVELSNTFGGSAWTLVGCGDFDGGGKDQVVMALNGGELYYAVGIDGVASELTKSDSGWEIRAIGDFSGDGKDDIVAFHKETGLVAMWGDGDAANKWSKLGQLDANDWFVVGCGDYDADAKDDLLVRQYSTGMLGYYSSGDMGAWTELGRGVDMNWTVIA